MPNFFLQFLSFSSLLLLFLLISHSQKLSDFPTALAAHVHVLPPPFVLLSSSLHAADLFCLFLPFTREQSEDLTIAR